jgi:alkylhydroperoxidase family enzyme
MTRVTVLCEGPTELEQVWCNRNDYYLLFVDDYLRSMRRVDPVLVELARIRIAQLVESALDAALRYRAAGKAGLTEAKIAAITDYPTSELFSDRERAVLEFTEQFALQSSSISDEDCDRLQEHVDAEEFIYLVKALSTMDQFSRANSAFRIRPSERVPDALSVDFTIRPNPAATHG